MPPEANPSLRASSAHLAASSNPSGSLRSARPTWHKAPSARINNTEGKQRFIIFIAGGMTYSEMRCAYTVGQALGKDVYIGKRSDSTFYINRKANGINRLYTCTHPRDLLCPVTRSRSKRRWFQPSYTYTSSSPGPGSYEPPTRPISVIPRNPQLPTLATSRWSSFSCTYA